MLDDVYKDKYRIIEINIILLNYLYLSEEVIS